MEDNYMMSKEEQDQINNIKAAMQAMGMPIVPNEVTNAIRFEPNLDPPPVQVPDQESIIAEVSPVIEPVDVAGTNLEVPPETLSESVSIQERRLEDMETTIELGNENEEKKLATTKSTAKKKVREVQEMTEIYLSDNPYGLTPKQRKGLDAILTTNSIVEAAQISGIGERTLRRWRSEDENFKKALKEIACKQYEVSSIHVMGLLEQAFQAQVDLLENPYQPGAAAKQKAIDAIYKRSDKYYDIMQIKEKIERLSMLGGGNVSNDP